VEVARFNCHPEPFLSPERCLARKCCYKPAFSPTTGSLELSVPWCYYPRDFPTYQVKTNESTAFGQRLTIVKQQSSYMPKEILSLTVDLLYETSQRFRLRIYDSTTKRFKVPLQVPVVGTKANITD
jgi:hypothetical protein